MKKLLAMLCAFMIAVPFTAGCSKNVDYTQYISESRSDIFIYKDDDKEIKLYVSEREQPYSVDGVKGETCPIAELYVKLPKNPAELHASLAGHEGEMNYLAVDNCYFLSFSAENFNAGEVEITLTQNGESQTYTALSIKDAGVMDCKKAVLCVAEHASELFGELTANGVFNAEIYVRLLYDEGCYYYVGVCTKTDGIYAYLLDGEHGKVIAEKHLK